EEQRDAVLQPLADGGPCRAADPRVLDLCGEAEAGPVPACCGCAHLAPPRRVPWRRRGAPTLPVSPGNGARDRDQAPSPVLPIAPRCTSPAASSRRSAHDGTIVAMTILENPTPPAGQLADRSRGAAPTTGDAPRRRTLTIGPHTIDTPVVRAPMAGITNMAFRLLCREFGALHSEDDGGLYVSEMVTTRALVEDHRESWRLVTMGAQETPRSVQLYGVDPATVRRAVEMIRERDLADHIDLNFGCPVPKVTRRGGGGVLPWKTELFTRIVSAAVEAAGPEVPVTVKTRIGIDDEHQTFRDAGLIAQEVGAAAIALHGRTVVQHYSG